MESEINLNAIIGFLEPKKIKPKKKKSVKITQLHSSFAGCDILKKPEELEGTKAENIKQKDAKAQSLVNLEKKFDEC